MQAFEQTEPKGPHPAFGHLLPSCFAFGYARRAKAIIIRAFARERSEWEKVGEARMRALSFSTFEHQHLHPPALTSAVCLQTADHSGTLSHPASPWLRRTGEGDMLENFRLRP